MDCIVHISNGQITNRKAVKNFFEGLDDGKYLVKAEQFKKRSLDQNAYYHGVVVPMVKEGLREAGYNEVRTNEDAHEILKHLFLKKQLVSKKDGLVIEVAGSTAKLKTTEFNQYLEEIWQWASSYLSITIPAPNQQVGIWDNVAVAEYDYDLGTTIIE